jgi:hypothetical protein
MERSGRIGGTVLALVLAGCSASPQEPTGTGAVTVTKAVSATNPSYDVSVSIVFTVENRGPTSISYRPCLTVVQQLVENRWTGRWSQSCLLYGDLVYVIPPGESKQDSIVVEYDRHAGQAEWLSGPVDGTYRVLTDIKDREGILLPTPQRTSATFSLKE